MEKRSRFIARVWPVETEAEATGHIAEMRAQHRDANHNVYAYILRNGQIMRYSDDGEPQGTSGLPTLGVFQSEKIHNVCCVVTRYFGGVLLGAGGLVRAYSKAAKLALDQAGINIMRQWNVTLIPCGYALFERTKAQIASCGGVIESTEFGADVLIEALIPIAASENFSKQITDMSAGSIEALVLDTVFRGARLQDFASGG